MTAAILDRDELVDIARKAAADGNLEEAEICWRAVLERQPDHAEAAFGVVRALVGSRHHRNALVYLTRAIQSGYRDQGLLTVAETCVSGIVAPDHDGADPKKDEEAAADALVGHLRRASDSQIWPSARQALHDVLVAAGVDELSLARQPGSDAELWIGQALPSDKLQQQVEATLDPENGAEPAAKNLADLKADPDNAEAWFALGRFCLGRESTEIAEELFRRAAHLQPDSIKYGINLARTLVANGRYVTAFRAYTALLGLPSQSRTDGYHLEEAAANRRSLLSRLILLTRQAITAGDPARAWNIFLMIRQEPDLQDADGIRAAILRLSIDKVMQAHREGAAETIGLARAHLERDPESVYVRQVLGQALMTARRYREASEMWGSLTVSAPDNARMFLQYAKCLERSGAGEGAIEAAKRALELDPGLESARIIHDRLSE